MLIVKMAFRNLWRHGTRTAVTGISLAAAVALLLYFEALVAGSHEQIIERDLRLFAGHVVVRPRGYEISRDLSLLFHDWGSLASRIRQAVPGVQLVPVLETSGSMRTAEGTVMLEYVFGVDHEAGRTQRLIARHIVRGTYLTGKKGELVIGRLAARTLGVNVGDRVVVSMAAHGQRVDEMFKVAGIFFIGGSNDTRIAVVNLWDLQRILGVSDGISQISVFGDLKESASMASRIKKVVDFPGLQVLAWSDAEQMLAQLMWLDSVSAYVFLVIIFLIIEASILNTVLMGIMERRRQLGVLMAIGMKPRLLFLEVLTETFLMALGAAVIGTVIFLPLHYLTMKYGIDIRAMTGSDSIQMAEVAMTGRIYTKFYPLTGLWSLLGVIVLTMLTALYPAWSVTRLRPVEAMRKN